MIGLLVVSVIWLFIIVEVEIMSLSQGFHLNALYIINHIQSLGPKLFAFCLIIYYFVMVLALLSNVYFVYLTCYCVDDLGG